MSVRANFRAAGPSAEPNRPAADVSETVGAEGQVNPRCSDAPSPGRFSAGLFFQPRAVGRADFGRTDEGQRAH